eukprot:SM000033S12368  [mRNA]  locus=s33:507579:508923:+ [translate_table: standard]
MEKGRDAKPQPPKAAAAAAAAKKAKPEAKHKQRDGGSSSGSRGGITVSWRTTKTTTVSAAAAAKKKAPSAKPDGKKERKVYDSPGQKHDPPEERDPLRLFYESLRQQNPASEMAEVWLLEHGMLALDQAKKAFERYQRRKGKSSVLPSKKPKSPSAANGAAGKAVVVRATKKVEVKRSATPVAASPVAASATGPAKAQVKVEVRQSAAVVKVEAKPAAVKVEAKPAAATNGATAANGGSTSAAGHKRRALFAESDEDDDDDLPLSKRQVKY